MIADWWILLYSILFLMGALMPLRARIGNGRAVTGTDSVGVPTSHDGSVGHGHSYKHGD
jgi:hypothetical protein